MTRKRAAVFRYLFWTAMKLALLLVVVVGLYTIYLDSALTKRFSTERYQAPALVYARAMELYPGASLSLATVEAELQRLNYRPVMRLTDSGQYLRQGNSLALYRRPFDFPDGPRMAQAVKVEFSGADGIARVLSLPDGRELNRFSLEAPYLGRITGGNNEDRLLVGLERVPNLLIETLLLIEDQDFYHHSGVSVSSIGRAALANLAAMKTVQGGSTLTQQLVKNLYLTRDQTLWRKANEALMALIIDYRFSKNEILETYLNEVYFGQDGGAAIHGVGLASRHYFGKQVQELEAAEIALLIAVIKGPSYYNPRRYPERAQQRRDMILQLMFSQDLISRDGYLVALEQPLTHSPESGRGTQQLAHYLELVKQELTQLYLPMNWQREGLRVFTYLDPIAQRAAEQSLAGQIERVSKDPLLQGAVVISDHQQAGITALVGDRQPHRAGFNRARDAIRPVGSLIKPFIYGIALESPATYNLATPIADDPVKLAGPDNQIWEPKNFDNTFKGSMLLYDALAQSRNVPAVRLGMDIGLPVLVERLQQAGVSTPIAAYPSLTLGAMAVSPLTVTELYSTLASQGQYRPLQAVKAVTNHQGLSLYERPQPAAHQVFARDAAYLVTTGLQGVVNEGTGKALGARFGKDVLAGKSGTTNDYRDSWFVVFDGQQVITSWLGRDDNQPIGLTGSSGALHVVSEILATTGIRPMQRVMPASLQLQAFHPVTGVAIPEDCSEARLLPAPPQQLTEDMSCSGEPREKSWWRRIF
ncbi:peptidoglycan synthetase [Pseudidiomarina salinarum]|uniref:Penicillin-binding protein 1B n=1 Tax=Pseudidiomarina salinarum TaxID=435908 RepID=A0A094ITB7_9GAMM|nr:penicillin-binding protein 1B [Pseudidiomarina salinarum]KFZ30357.1 peptidoglycan synthetase [Pseudidiomarina salinarum]RUO68507.1 penicillin-binding protein 1B [Pseudidiomarina salinarum]